MVDFAQSLGADQRAAGQKFSIYIADRDRLGNAVPGVEGWIGAALSLLSGINGGATKLAPTVGYWQSDTGEMVVEETTIIFSYVKDAENFANRLPDIAAFLHMYGKDTNQGEVVAELFGEDSGGFVNRFYYISDYALAPEAE